MTGDELAQHLTRVGGRLALARMLPCSRTTVRKWTKGQVNVPARWADRIRSLPHPPPKPARKGAPAPAAPAPAPPRQLSLPFVPASAAPPPPPAKTKAKARARKPRSTPSHAQEARA